ncbi:MAG: nucleotide-binding protein, partial [Treponema sp.]|nr:nucleotide-binding protein [Treponema sp.]
MKQKVFIGCSTESLEVAKAIQIELDHEHFSTIWTQDIFKLTSTTLEDLITATAVHDFAIFIFSPDDVAVIREKSSQIVRDNVVFELGLFLG